jgi:hypothetical protein
MNSRNGASARAKASSRSIGEQRRHAFARRA